jgi:hypothetical protein
MSQRISGYQRIRNEAYATTATWPVGALLSVLGPIRRAWDPCDGSDGSGHLVATIRAQGVVAVGTCNDFLAVSEPPTDVDAIICNPPYGERRRGEMAMAFIEHALVLPVARICMLLRSDFDSAITRQCVFRNCARFAGKLVLLNRIRWFEGSSSPSDNHAWYLWFVDHVGPPIIRYVTRAEAEAAMKQPAIGRYS